MLQSSLDQPLMAPLRSPGRKGLSVAGYGIGTALMMVTPLLVFVPAALFSCGLRYGRKAAWGALAIAAAVGSVYFAQVGAISPREAALMSWSSFLGMLLAIGVPSVAALPLLERREKFGTVLAFALIASVIGLATTEAVMQSAAGFSPFDAQVAEAKKTAAGMLEVYRKANISGDFVSGMELWMDRVLFVVPAWLVVDAALIFILSLMMLGRVKAWKAFTNGAGVAAADEGRVYLLRNFALPEWVLFAFVFSGLTPIASGMLQKIAANVLAVLVFLFVLQGLAIFRSMLVAAGAGVVATVLGFTLLAFLSMTGIGLLLLGVAGLFDSFFDFRHIKRKDGSHESHSD